MHISSKIISIENLKKQMEKVSDPGYVIDIKDKIKDKKQEIKNLEEIKRQMLTEK